MSAKSAPSAQRSSARTVRRDLFVDDDADVERRHLHAVVETDVERPLGRPMAIEMLLVIRLAGAASARSW